MPMHVIIKRNNSGMFFTQSPLKMLMVFFNTIIIIINLLCRVNVLTPPLNVIVDIRNKKYNHELYFKLI